ncbi:hypothetical protein F2Q69_00018646 [Brassica cretica]|uniref:VAN3-binding protein-like auxin canalisation domain-containing protein n=1 Tax=Brassica cretica TaxID=69181 RepID=A0A8S9Q8E3_BRACR|nr:hypothetical protein F2Q69_00018646 [Brassica cretica]
MKACRGYTVFCLVPEASYRCSVSLFCGLALVLGLRPISANNRCLDPENGRLSKWFHQKQHTNPNTMRNPKRKDKERVERARVHSAVSIAALAAGLASVTSSESCSKESGLMMTLALASATELLASHCIEMAEQAGADGIL